jgi:hypothetical protein
MRMMGAYVLWMASVVVAFWIFGDELVALIASLFILVPAVRWASSR